MYDLSTLQTACTQDRTGTCAQLTLAFAPENPVEIGDTGVYNGMNDGNAVALNFTVGALGLDENNFCITTQTPTGAAGNFLASRWPTTGYLVWETGANVGIGSPDPEVIAMNVANAYITPDFLAQYANSRGTFTYPSSPVDAVWQSIVVATDYLDQRYRYRGIKFFQWTTNPFFDPNIAFIDPWLGEYDFFGGGPGSNFAGWFTPSATFQHTQWPRAGVTDSSGDQVYGVPLPVMQATAEVALRVLNGVVAQPDYDATVFASPGAIISETVSEVGPIRVSQTMDTKFGTGFFPEFPQVKRMLTSAGLLVAGGNRSIVR
jgi:hypothetical protein